MFAVVVAFTNTAMGTHTRPIPFLLVARWLWLGWKHRNGCCCRTCVSLSSGVFRIYRNDRDWMIHDCLIAHAPYFNFVKDSIICVCGWKRTLMWCWTAICDNKLQITLVISQSLLFNWRQGTSSKYHSLSYIAPILHKLHGLWCVYGEWQHCHGYSYFIWHCRHGNHPSSLNSANQTRVVPIVIISSTWPHIREILSTHLQQRQELVLLQQTIRIQKIPTLVVLGATTTAVKHWDESHYHPCHHCHWYKDSFLRLRRNHYHCNNQTVKEDRSPPTWTMMNWLCRTIITTWQHRRLPTTTTKR